MVLCKNFRISNKLKVIFKSKFLISQYGPDGMPKIMPTNKGIIN